MPAGALEARIHCAGAERASESGTEGYVPDTAAHRAERPAKSDQCGSQEGEDLPQGLIAARNRTTSARVGQYEPIMDRRGLPGAVIKEGFRERPSPHATRWQNPRTNRRHGGELRVVLPEHNQALVSGAIGYRSRRCARSLSSIRRRMPHKTRTRPPGVRLSA